MRHPALLGFCVSTAVLVPAALVHLEAGPEQQARLFAPKASSIIVDGVRVDASLDKPLVDDGAAVTLSLRASAATTVTVLVAGSGPMADERTSEPPKEIRRATVNLAAGATATVPVQLHGAARVSASTAFGDYTFFVMSPANAASLGRWLRAPSDEQDRVRAATSGEVHALIEAIHSTLGPYGKEDYTGTAIARLEAHTRPTPYAGFAIEAPDHVRRGESFDVAVRVTNPSTRPRSVEIDLDAQPIDDKYLGGSFDLVAIDGRFAHVELGPEETRRLPFRVRGDRAGILALHAFVHCADREPCERLYPDGAIEAVSVH